MNDSTSPTPAAREPLQLLQAAGILPTLQRLAVAEVLLPRPCHMTADAVLAAVRRRLPGLSRATVYAVLQLMARHGLVRALPMEGAATVYDSNPAQHHHLLDVETGEVRDLPDCALQVLGLGEALHGLELESVDVIVRVRRATRSDGPSPPAAPA